MSLHISSAFNEDLTLINAKVNEMGGLCEKMLEASIKAIKKSDVNIADQIIILDEKINTLEIEVNHSVIKAIALRQPVADDLRVLISAIKISGAFERIGDLCKNIAKRTRLVLDDLPKKTRDKIANLGEKVLEQLTKSINSYTKQDLQLAKIVWEKDYEIDEMYTELFDVLLKYLKKKKRIAAGSHLVIIAKNFERIGDHTTHISRMIHFAITGETLDLERPKFNLPSSLEEKNET